MFCTFSNDNTDDTSEDNANGSNHKDSVIMKSAEFLLSSVTNPYKEFCLLTMILHPYDDLDSLFKDFTHCAYNDAHHFCNIYKHKVWLCHICAKPLPATFDLCSHVFELTMPETINMLDNDDAWYAFYWYVTLFNILNQLPPSTSLKVLADCRYCFIPFTCDHHHHWLIHVNAHLWIYSDCSDAIDHPSDPVSCKTHSSLIADNGNGSPNRIDRNRIVIKISYKQLDFNNPPDSEEDNPTESLDSIEDCVFHNNPLNVQDHHDEDRIIFVFDPSRIAPIMMTKYLTNFPNSVDPCFLANQAMVDSLDHAMEISYSSFGYKSIAKPMINDKTALMCCNSLLFWHLFYSHPPSFFRFILMNVMIRGEFGTRSVDDNDIVTTPTSTPIVTQMGSMSAHTDEFYILRLNPCLQVEHPVTKGIRSHSLPYSIASCNEYSSQHYPTNLCYVQQERPWWQGQDWFHQRRL